MTTTLEIVYPNDTKGLDRDGQYWSRNKIKDEHNYMDIGVIVRVDGEVRRDQTVVVASNRDATQDKTIPNTGSIFTIRHEDGQREKLHYYPYHYEFTKPGQHKITFTSGGVSAECDVLVTPDTRPDTP